MNILAMGAHPDDMEIGCGGTLLKYARSGHDIHMLVLTDGSCGGDLSARREEQEESARLLGAREVIWGGYKDARLPLDQGLIQSIEDVVKKVGPRVIFVPYFDDTHQDHRHLSHCAISATRYTRNVMYYECPTTQNFTPTVFVDITDVMEGKVEALTAHASQVDKTRVQGMDIVSIARATAHFRGTLCKVTSAEGFMPLRLFMDICNTK